VIAETSVTVYQTPRGRFAVDVRRTEPAAENRPPALSGRRSVYATREAAERAARAALRLAGEPVLA
jgi:hypothetical protein